MKRTHKQRMAKHLWELKRTKNWSDNWLVKLRDDQHTAKAENFPAGLVIYWAWNNTLSVTQEASSCANIGQKAKIELANNVNALFGAKKEQT